MCNSNSCIEFHTHARIHSRALDCLHNWYGYPDYFVRKRSPAPTGIAMFVLYTVAPLLYRLASSAYFNLSLLSSDFYGLIFGKHPISNSMPTDLPDREMITRAFPFRTLRCSFCCNFSSNRVSCSTSNHTGSTSLRLPWLYWDSSCTSGIRRVCSSVMPFRSF